MVFALRRKLGVRLSAEQAAEELGRKETHVFQTEVDRGKWKGSGESLIQVRGQPYYLLTESSRRRGRKELGTHRIQT